jgi:bifunctional oligoribonuclease and PAP phosphatase NrnA
MSLRTNSSFPALAERIRAARTFAIVSHYRPDGDALGSSLALALSLQAMGKEVRVFNEDGVPESLRFLPGANLIERPSPTAVNVDIAIAVDCATRERLGKQNLTALAGAGHWMNLDHHRSNEDYGDSYYIAYDKPATGELLYDFLTATAMPMTPEIAANLYVGISTDTGSFQYQSTTAHTYEVGAALIRAGANIAALNQQTYERYPLRRVQLLSGLLNAMQLTHEGRVASWAITQALLTKSHAISEDTEGLIDTLRAIDGVVVAAAFEELDGPDGKIRVSLRSKDTRIDVAKICATVGGGGHALAAGARLTGPLDAAQARIFQAISHAFNEASLPA